MNSLNNNKIPVEELPSEHKGNVRYTLKNETGEGAYGKVYKSHDNKLNEEVAVKKVIFENEEESLKNVYREIILLKTNRHPNILRLFDIYIPLETTDAYKLNEVYFVFELMDRTLDSVIKNKNIKLKQKNISYILYQIFCAVQHLHKSKIIHRDVKPKNIGLTTNYRVKLLDFGMSRKMMEDKMTAGLGTEHYSAPEIARNELYDEKVDVWSIGCVMSEMLRRKESAYNTVSRLNQLEKGTYRWEKHYGNKYFKSDDTLTDPTALEYINAKTARDFLSKMLTVDIKNRISSTDAFKQPYIRIYYRREETCLKPTDLTGFFDQPSTKELIYETIKQTTQECNHESNGNGI